MNIQPRLLSPQGLLAALVAMTLSGAAIAETAGRVNFVTGAVTAVSPTGGKRILTRGDFINSGERIETNDGRVQIRFTDGSFLSLQPDTVFGVDNYTFSKAQPESGSLLFNFVRGSMRTVSGAIGKVNRASYKVKTPVATIGIRGTGYASTYRNGLLLVSVNHGLVNVSNDSGSSNVGVGQTFQTRDGQAPAPAPEGMTAGGRADDPDGNTPGDGLGGAGGDRIEMAANRDVAPEVLPPDAPEEQPLSPIMGDSVDGTPVYAAATPLLREAFETSSVLAMDSSATFNTGANTRGGLATLSGSEGIPIVSQPSTNAAKQVNVQTSLWNGGGVSFGEWTGGGLILGGSVSRTLANNQFMPYIIGSQAAMPTGNFYIEYSLTAASTPRVSAGGALSGSLDKLNLGLDLANATAYVTDMQVTMTPADSGTSTVYTATGSGLSINLSNKGFELFNGLLAYSEQDSACVNGCRTQLAAFATGPTGKALGSNYIIHGAMGSSIQGVALLQQDGLPFPIRDSLADTESGASSNIFPLYTMASTVADGDGDMAVFNVMADFEQTPGANQGGLLSLTDRNASTPLFTSNNAGFVNLMTDKVNQISIGEITGGTVFYEGDVPPLVKNVSFMPYVIGIDTGIVPDGNTRVSYTLATLNGAAFASTPRFSDGRNLGATLNKLNVDFDLSTSRVGVDFKLTTGSAANQTVYTATTSELSALGLSSGNIPQFELGAITAFSVGQDNTCTSGCDFKLAATFMGANADRLGTAYQIELGNNVALGGVAVLQGASTPLTQFPDMMADDLTHSSSVLFMTNSNTYAPKTVEAANVFFNQVTGALIAAQYTDGSQNTVTLGRFGDLADPAVTESKHYRNTLSWGRWISSDSNNGINVIDYDLPNGVALGLANSTVHYLAGTITTPAGIDSVKGLGNLQYVMVGGTSPTLLFQADKVSPSQTIAGTLTGGLLNIDFQTGASSLSISGNLTAPVAGSLNFYLAGSATQTATDLSNARLSFANLQVSINDISCSTCTGSANGLIAGPAAEVAGVSYRFDTGAGTPPVSGVVGFDRTGSTGSL